MKKKTNLLPADAENSMAARRKFVNTEVVFSRQDPTIYGLNKYLQKMEKNKNFFCQTAKNEQTEEKKDKRKNCKNYIKSARNPKTAKSSKTCKKMQKFQKNAKKAKTAKMQKLQNLQKIAKKVTGKFLVSTRGNLPRNEKQ